MTKAVAFLRETYDELQKVVWPTRNEVVRLTGIVLAISLMMGAYIGALDYIFTTIMGFVLK